jgi:hypothetical protein
VALVGVRTSHQGWFRDEGSAEGRAYRVLTALLKDSEVQQLLRVNRYQNVLWYTQKAFEQLLWWLFVVAVIQRTAAPRRPSGEVAEEITRSYRVIRERLRAGQKADYRVEKLLEGVKE